MNTGIVSCSRRKTSRGVSYYTITNQRLGRILLDVTKEWIDGDGTRRTELREALKTQGLGLYAKLICDQAGVIDYQKGTINTGTGEHAPVDADGKTVSMYQEISIDTAVKIRNFISMIFQNTMRTDLSFTIP